MSAALGQQIKEADITVAFLTQPAQDLVIKLLAQMASVKGMLALFGPYTPKKAEQRWADYQRFDWSMRQLPAINVFESGIEDKTSDQGFLNGTLQIQVFWPASFRRSDLMRIPNAFKGVLEQFFASKYTKDMLDELYFIQRPMKVYGLNELGKTLTWSPNTEGFVGSETVPVTILDVKYRIDLRSWYRALEFMGRTKDNPFEETLANLNLIRGEYDGIESAQDFKDNNIEVVILDGMTVTNP